MTDRLKNNVILAFLGHAGLILSIVADFFRRNSQGGWFFILSVGGAVALMLGGLLFIKHPNYFFFCEDYDFVSRPRPSLGWRVVAWILVIGAPIFWIILISEMQREGPIGLGARLIGGYIFFAWVAVTIILWPILFVKH